MTTSRPVTVVVPIYGDLESLTRCVAALVSTVDTGIHSVLLVDDRGPDSDEIGAAVLAQIAGLSGFRLERNASNLGFVGTCNRAAFELDTGDNDLLFLNSDAEPTAGFLEELTAVLALSPQHGAVCPRSNNATIASLPFRLRDPSVGRLPERSRRVHDALAGSLPRFSVTPVSMGFCILVRRDLVRRFGLFDETFAPGYGEENDFCLRIGQHGFLSLLANRALVFHEGSKSFTGLRRDILRARHEVIVNRRYPDFRDAVARYLWAGADVADLFADLLVPGEGLASVLVVAGDGLDSAADALATLDGARVTATTASALPYLTGIFDLVVAPSGLTSDDLRCLDRSALRWLLVAPDRDDFATTTITPAQATNSDDLRRAVHACLATSADLERLRARHGEFAPPTSSLRDLRPPISSPLRRFRQAAVDKIPTIAITAEWAMLAVGRRLRARGAGRG